MTVYGTFSLVRHEKRLSGLIVARWVCVSCQKSVLLLSCPTY